MIPNNTQASESANQETLVDVLRGGAEYQEAVRRWSDMLAHKMDEEIFNLLTQQP